MKNTIKDLTRLLKSTVYKGANDGPYRVVQSVTELFDTYGAITVKETDALLKAIKIAMGFKVLDKDERDQLNNLFAEIKTGASNLDKEPCIQISAQLNELDNDYNKNNGKDLNFPSRLISSGLSVDGHYFFEASALRQAVDMFKDAQCFADHTNQGENPSVKNLVGWFTNPRIIELDNNEVAIEADLNVLKSSPFAKSLKELAERGALHTVGLSIAAKGDIEIRQGENGNDVYHVVKLTQIDSTDLVTKPNAGGKILELRQAVLAAVQNLPTDSDIYVTNDKPNTDYSTATTLNEINALRADIEAERTQNKIDALIRESSLPPIAIKAIEKRVRDAGTVQNAQQIIAQAVDLWAVSIEDQSRSNFNDSGVHVTAQPTRKILAIQGMLANNKVDNVQPYRSLRQAFADVTGRNVSAMSPQQFATAVIRGSWGFSSENENIFASIDDSDWPYALGQALLREVVRQYQLPQFDEWRDLVGPNIGNLNDMRAVTRLRTGYFDLLPTVAKGGTYQSLSEPSEERISYTPSKRGGTADFTWEDALNDDLNQLRQIPSKLAMSAKVTLWYSVLNEIAKTTPTSMTYDSTAWFHADHKNLGTTALTIAAISAARKAIMTQSVLSASTINIGAKPKFLWIPPDLEEKALKLKNSEYDPNIGDASTSNPWKDTFEIRIIPFWSNATAWAMTADPALVPVLEVGFLGGNENPELATEAENSGSNFSADKVTYRVKQVFGVQPLDHRGVYKQVPV